MLIFFQNIVSIVGWISEVIPPIGDDGFKFRLVHGDYHEHFHNAVCDTEKSIVMEIRLSRHEGAERCREHLKVGDRVTVRGRLATENQLVNGTISSAAVWIHAFDIERCETLESYRYVNHPWRATLEATPTKPKGSANVH